MNSNLLVRGHLCCHLLALKLSDLCAVKGLNLGPAD